MFTGLIQHVGYIASLQPTQTGARLCVDPRNWDHHPAVGESIAVNGCCLTIAPQLAGNAAQARLLQFDLVHQTINSTTLGTLGPGEPVNLEHAVTPDTLLGGHVVQGHVDGVGVVNRVSNDDSQWLVRIAPPAKAMAHIIERGSIAVDGVSLTIAAVGDDWFEVALIPTTLAATNLRRLKAGARVNLETDYLAKIVVNWLGRQQSEV
ncbi:MAG: riboflavin synthase [Phycisphaerales bacterium]|nr:riboflavin synthase [Phycisphaerales bacterium]MCI0629622.1 riboflavin synthase [Phycisphaerales bacterium]MCI0675907.1 riboflavin synthase [Phycisphaerales bacterium]